MSPRASLLLVGDDLAQALHRIDGEGAELARRLARLAAQAIDALAHQEGLEADGEQERQQRQRQPAAGSRPARATTAAGTRMATKAGATVWAKKYSTSSMSCVASAIKIAGAPAHQVGRRQRIELAEGVDAHLGQQAEAPCRAPARI